MGDKELAGVKNLLLDILQELRNLHLTLKRNTDSLWVIEKELNNGNQS